MKNFVLNLLLFISIGIVVIFSYSMVERHILKRKTENIISKKSLRIEVLNGAGVSKLAQKVAAELRERGFDVVYFGNSKVEVSTTCIFDRKSPDLKAGKLLEKEIECSKVYFEADPDNLIDVTLLLGKDYKKYFPEIEKEWE